MHLFDVGRLPRLVILSLLWTALVTCENERPINVDWCPERWCTCVSGNFKFGSFVDCLATSPVTNRAYRVFKKDDVSLDFSYACEGERHGNDPDFADKRGPDVIHAWTTRENVRVLAEKLRSRHRSRGRRGYR